MYVNDIHKSICEKLGYDAVFMPKENDDDKDWYEDDREKENPMSVLTTEELDFLIETRLKFLGVE